MALASIPVRITSRRNFDKSDVESIYAALVQKIGGSYFVSGGGVGPVAGTLDWRNFAPNAGITNQYKQNKNGLFEVVIQDRLPYGNWVNGTTNYQNVVPMLPGQSGTFTIVEWDLTLVGGLPTAGNWTLGYTRNGSANTIQTVTQATFTLGGGTLTASRVTGLSTQVMPGDILTIAQVITTAGVNTPLILKHSIWIKTEHVRP